MSDEHARIKAYAASYSVLNELKRREALDRSLDERVRMMDQAYAFAASQGWADQRPFDLEQNALWLRLKRMDGERADAER